MLPNYTIWIAGGSVHITRPDHPESMVISGRQAAHHLMTYDDIRRQRDGLAAALEGLLDHVTIDVGLPEHEVTIAKARAELAKNRETR
jgi:hypothetical protein